eukprot:385737_1
MVLSQQPVLTCFLCLTIISTASINYQPWGIQSNVMPMKARKQAVGLHTATNTIWLLGGISSGKRLLSFDVANASVIDHSDILPTNVPYYTSIQTEFYTQIDNILWISRENMLDTFDLSTQKYTMDVKTVNAMYYCLASMKSDHNYLILTGGRLPHGYPSDSINTTQILNLTDHQWLSNVPDMIFPRQGHGCAVANQTLVIYQTKYVEMLDLSNLDQIENALWGNFTITNFYSYVSGYSRTVVVGDEVLALGGYCYCNFRHFSDNTIVGFNVVTKTFRRAGSMAQQLFDMAVIKTNYYIWAFGGHFADPYYSDMDFVQFYAFPSAFHTAKPTLAPSNNPTYDPTYTPTSNTQSPTFHPTSIPTSTPTTEPSQPTFQPTYGPTLEPSFYPTMVPSNSPSNAPSISPSITPSAIPSATTSTPTQDPSLSPTKSTTAPSFSPSNSPTNAPSVLPSNAPSIGPTLAPSIVPSFAPSLTPSMIPSSAPTTNTLNPTNIPTTSPTYEPTLIPTIIPTNHPSKTPTKYPTKTPFVSPTKHPTQSTINPTTNPTIPPTKATANPSDNPTIFPTLDPTQPPSVAPSLNPSINPSLAPSLTPSFAPSLAPSNNPTLSPTNAPLSVAEKLNLGINYHLINYHLVVYALLCIIPISVIFTAVMCKCFVNKASQNKIKNVDDQRYVSVLLFFVQLVDMYSDALFTTQLYGYYIFGVSSYDNYIDRDTTNTFQKLFICSLSFILVPYILNFVSSITIVSRIQNDLLVNEHTKQWFNNKSKWYSIGVLLSGNSYRTLNLFNSNLFGINTFHCGLSKSQIQRFKSHHVAFTVLIENLPQFIIQMYFVFYLELMTTTVIISSLSSIFNILFIVMSTLILFVSNKHQQEFVFTIKLSWEKQKKIINNQIQKNIVVTNKRGREIVVKNLDPYSRLGRRKKLAKEMTQINRAHYPFEFEILSSDTRTYGALIYGVIKVPNILDNKQEKINEYFKRKERVQKAIFDAFEYETLFANKFKFNMDILCNYEHQSKNDKDLVVIELMHNLEYIKANEVALSLDTINKIRKKLDGLTQEIAQNGHTVVIEQNNMESCVQIDSKQVKTLQQSKHTPGISSQTMSHCNQQDISLTYTDKSSHISIEQEINDNGIDEDESRLVEDQTRNDNIDVTDIDLDIDLDIDEMEKVLDDIDIEP